MLGTATFRNVSPALTFQLYILLGLCDREVGFRGQTFGESDIEAVHVGPRTAETAPRYAGFLFAKGAGGRYRRPSLIDSGKIGVQPSGLSSIVGGMPHASGRPLEGINSHCRRQVY